MCILGWQSIQYPIRCKAVKVPAYDLEVRIRLDCETNMKNTPGIAAQVFGAITGTNADIRLITTSEVEISLLVTEADFDTVLAALQKAMA